MAANNSVNISFTVNGERFNNVNVPSRQHLADYLRSQGFTGTHLGCEQGACGACTIEMDGKAVRSCLVFGPIFFGSVVGAGSSPNGSGRPVGCVSPPGKVKMMARWTCFMTFWVLG